jgi:hypothetical protein
MQKFTGDINDYDTPTAVKVGIGYTVVGLPYGFLRNQQGSIKYYEHPSNAYKLAKRLRALGQLR